MIKIAICDDENEIAARIEHLLEAICKRKSIPIDIDVYYSGLGLEKHYKEGERYDLLYMDIQMKDKNGIHTAANIRKMDESVMLIFISAHDKYLISLFRLDVYAFIPKPINPDEFEEIFHEAHEKISRRSHYFTFRYMNIEHKILCMNILYFRSEGRKIFIHTVEGAEEIFNGKISAVEEKLSKGKVPFLRVHQSYLVNYHMIKSRTRAEVTMANGQRIPISEERQKLFNIEYGKLVGKI